MIRTTSIGISFLLFASLSAVGQDKGSPAPPPIEGVLPGLGQPANPQEEILELFKSVERRLKAIDDLLSDASRGATNKLANVGESGMSDLIRRSRNSSERAVEEINRLLLLLENQP